MLKSLLAARGMATAPHHLAAQSAASVLREGGNAVAAMVAAAATIAVVYSHMNGIGGDGQPQTQAAVFSRYTMFGQDLQQAVSAPRWLLGRTWGEMSVTLKLESRMDAAVAQALCEAGHDVELIDAWSDSVGHAGALVLRPGGVIEGAADPRSDGAVAAL